MPRPMLPVDCRPVDSHVSVTASPVIVVADDLIWATRLAGAVTRAGGTTAAARSVDELRARLLELPAGAAVLVDLNGRAYDGLEAIRAAADSGARVIAVGQHEAIDERRQALGAGARRVFSYNKLFRDGPQVVARLIDGRL